MRIASFILAAIILAGCSQPPKYQYETLGTVGIVAHKTPIGGALRQLCQFRVEVAGQALGYAGSSTFLVQHNKCLTMKNGDSITVTRRTRISGDDKLPAIRYLGKINEVEFVLN